MRWPSRTQAARGPVAWGLCPARLTACTGQKDARAKADDVVEAELGLYVFVQLLVGEAADVVEAALAQNRYAHAIGNHLTQAKKQRVLEVIATLCELGLVHRLSTKVASSARGK